MPTTKKEIVARTITCGLVLFCFTLCAVVLAAQSDAAWGEARLAYNTSNLIRLHVVAPADDSASSCLKLAVRDAILGETSSLLESAKDAHEAETRIRANLGRIQRMANEVVARAGFSHSVRVTLGMEQFPAISYGQISLPSGSYLALTASIGPAAGSNWWCILFPPLCLVDVTEGCIIEARQDGNRPIGLEFATRSLLFAPTAAEKEAALYHASRATQRATLAQLNWELPEWICRLLGLSRFDQAKR